MNKCYALLDFDGYICKAFYAANSKKGSDKDAYEILSDLYISAIERAAEYFEVEQCDIEPVLVVSAHSWKKDVYPTYKSHRKKNEELGKFRDSVIEMDADIVKVEQLEADEVLIMLDTYIGYVNDNPNIIIFSDDKDLKYYATNYCKINPINGVEKYTAVEHQNRYAQMLAGDKEDNITGIPKVGMVTANKLLGTLGYGFNLDSVIRVYKEKGVSYNDCLHQLAQIIPVGGVASGVSENIICSSILDKEEVDSSLVQVSIERTLEYIKDRADLIYG